MPPPPQGGTGCAGEDQPPLRVSLRFLLHQLLPCLISAASCLLRPLQPCLTCPGPCRTEGYHTTETPEHTPHARPASEAGYSDGEWQVKGHLCPAFLPWRPSHNFMHKALMSVQRGEGIWDSGGAVSPRGGQQQQSRGWVINFFTIVLSFTNVSFLPIDPHPQPFPSPRASPHCPCLAVLANSPWAKFLSDNCFLAKISAPGGSPVLPSWPFMHTHMHPWP